MRWIRVTATDPYARALADRHYPRQNKGAKFFTPPGAKVVLRTECARAYWVSLFQLPEFTDHSWPGAWLCSAFRNESEHRSSDLILEALAATVAEWGPVPSEGMITFVDAEATSRRRSRRNPPGHCFRKAGFVDAGERTTRGLHVLRLSGPNFPAGVEALHRQGSLALEVAS